MPTYEYQCQACGQQHEEFQKISDAPLTDCPSCHKPALTKLVSATNFQLKGTGWYVTDFKDKKSTAPTITETKPEKPPTSNDSNSSTGQT